MNPIRFISFIVQGLAGAIKPFEQVRNYIYSDANELSHNTRTVRRKVNIQIENKDHQYLVEPLFRRAAISLRFSVFILNCW